MATLEEIQQTEVDLPVSQTVEAFYKGTDAIKQFAEKCMIPVLQGQLNLDEHERAVTGTYYRMYLSILSLVALNRPCYFQTAASESRRLFELLLDLKLLSGDLDGKLTTKFHAFIEVDRFRVAKQVVEYNDLHEKSKIDDTHHRSLFNAEGKKESINQLIVHNWGTTKAGKPNKPEHWSGLKVKERAKQLGSVYEELYIESYPLMSWSVHAGSGNYAGLDKDSLESMLGLSHRISQNCFLEATILAAKVMKIEQVVEGFKDILEDLRLTPGKVIVAEKARIIDAAKNQNS
jgi:Family of unknown function (DUF5677)